MVIPVCIPNKKYENLNRFSVVVVFSRFVMDDDPGDKYLLEQTDAHAHESFQEVQGAIHFSHQFSEQNIPGQ